MLRVATRENHAIDRNRNVPGSAPRIVRILRNSCAGDTAVCDAWIVRIHERQRRRLYEESDRRDRADIKAADISVAAEIETLERRRNVTVIAGDKRGLKSVSERLFSFLVIGDALHRKELLPFHHRPNRGNVATQSGNLAGQRKARDRVGRMRLFMLKLRLGVTSLVMTPFSESGPATLLKFSSSKYKREKSLKTFNEIVSSV